jgi:predicted Zn-dependent protease
MNYLTSPPITISRRRFLQLSTLATAGLITGCATNPVTGESQLMLISEQAEIDIDRKHSPHQFSTDYGPLQDRALNQYIDQIGKNIAVKTHRPHMPYRFNGVNATYINAYAFPGGSIAATRGILLSLNNEAELGALLGHELGHVNARHTAEHMTKGMLTQAVVGGLSIYASTKGQIYGQLASQLGMLGAGALLAKYSRDNEREADQLGMKYMVDSGYNVDGFIGLMGMLNGLHKGKQTPAALLFATHPMSQERYQTAVQRADTDYSFAKGSSEDFSLHRDRYMDRTAALRRIKSAVISLQQGEKEMVQKQYIKAETLYNKALKIAPRDYAGLTMMAKCQLAQNKNRKSLIYANKAKEVYPQEAQAHHLIGLANIRQNRFSPALEAFSAYDAMLPGNPNTAFFMGNAYEGMGQKKNAASAYYRFLQNINQGTQAKHAYNQLVTWGYIKPEQPKAK